MTTPPIRAFRAVAYVEAATYLLLLGAVVVKRVLDGADYVQILGPIHGMVFLGYLILVLKIRESQGWNLVKTLWVLFASALPLGGFFVGRDLADEPAPATR